MKERARLGSVAARGLRRGVAVAALLGLASVTADAKADVQIVIDPGPAIGVSGVNPLVVGDFAETSPGTNEHYTLSGTAQNDAATTLHLLVSARANGSVIAESQQSFAMAPNGSTPFTYDFTWTGQPAPATVGLDVSDNDGTIAHMGGVFSAAPTPASAPAVGPWALAALAAGVLIVGARKSGPASLRPRLPG